MKTFRISYVKTDYATVVVEAEDREEAIQKATNDEDCYTEEYDTDFEVTDIDVIEG